MAEAYTHITTPTQYIEANGVRYAHRRFGAPTGVPLLLLQELRANMDHWDPAVTDGLGATRPIILFNDAGISTSGGEPARSIEQSVENISDFIDALGLKELDVLGFSLGGVIAQPLAIRRPDVVRRVVLVGTTPANGEDMDPWNPVFAENALVPQVGEKELLKIFFEQDEKSQRLGREYWARRESRTVDVDPYTTPEVLAAQAEATGKWGAPRENRLDYLKEIKQPVLVTNGIRDIGCPSINSYRLAEHIPNAQLILYPHSGHAAHSQYPELFVENVRLFLDRDDFLGYD